jgi:hypothetical protein
VAAWGLEDLENIFEFRNSKFRPVMSSVDS